MLHRIFVSAAAAAALLICGATDAATLVKQSAGPTQRTLEVSQSRISVSDVTQVTCPSYANLPGASVTVKVPSGPDELLTARFTAAGAVGPGANGAAEGAVRIVAGTRELVPVTNTYVMSSFDLPNAKTVALERSGVVQPGSHLVAVQYCTTDNDNGTQGFGLRDWHLTVEAAPVQ